MNCMQHFKLTIYTKRTKLFYLLIETWWQTYIASLHTSEWVHNLCWKTPEKFSIKILSSFIRVCTRTFCVTKGILNPQKTFFSKMEKSRPFKIACIHLLWLAVKSARVNKYAAWHRGLRLQAMVGDTRLICSLHIFYIDPLKHISVHSGQIVRVDVCTDGEVLIFPKYALPGSKFENSRPF